jgi:hypothetical protein
LEDYLLKPVIPFIRIGHLPRGSYFQVKGELIMISADVVESLRKILPVEQNLVPVSFKKKLEYTGHYIQEYVDKKKVQLYFDWFKRYNHLFQDYELDKKLITDYEKNALKSIKQKDTIEEHSTLSTDKFVNQNKDDSDHLEPDEEYEEKITLDPEQISSHHSSIITDKYQEDMDAPTVANKIANMIIELECKENAEREERLGNPDPDEIFYSEDEIFNSDDEDDADTEDESEDEKDNDSQLSYEESLKCNELKKIKKKLNKISLDCENVWPYHCRCSLSRQICFALEHIFDLENIDLNNSQLLTTKSEMLIELRKCVKGARVHIIQMDICTHDANNLNSIFEAVIKDNKENSNKTLDYVKKQTRLIKENAKKIFVFVFWGRGGLERLEI